jgi:hypothetical protein
VRKVVIRAYFIDLPDDQVQIVKDLITSEGEYDDDEVTEHHVATFIAASSDIGDMTEFITHVSEQVEEYPSA